MNEEFLQALVAEVRAYVDKRLGALPPGRDGRDGLPGERGAMGEKGIDGRDGRDGKNGTDSDLTRARFESTVVEEVGKAMVEFHKSLRVEGRKLMAGDLVLATFAVALYKGVFTEGTKYEPGDMVTFGGSVWAVNEETTTKPGNGNGAWTLAVKEGRAGRDGKA